MHFAHEDESESAFPAPFGGAYTPAVINRPQSGKALSMVATLRWTSIVLYSLLSAFFIWFGWLYASVDEPLWFHDAAVPDHAKEAVRPLYFALMNLIGGASLGLGFLGLCLTLTVLRKGAKWAGAALGLAYAAPLIMAAITAEELAKTGAPTSWRIMGVLLFVTAVAFIAHLASRRGRR